MEDLSLEAIENDRWGDAPDDATTLVKTVHELRRKPIDDFTLGDLRILIGQREGLAVLIPRALVCLADDPLLETDFYPGDLMATVLRVPREYWSTHPDQLTKMNTIIASFGELESDSVTGSVLSEEIESFRSSLRQ